MGYQGIFAESVERVLNGRSPNHVYASLFLLKSSFIFEGN